MKNISILKSKSILLAASLGHILFLTACATDTTNNNTANNRANSTAPEQSSTLSGIINYAFATPEQAGAILASDDEFTAVSQPLEIGIKNRDATKTTLADLKANYINGAVAWTKYERNALTQIISELRSDLDPYGRFLPKEILLGKIAEDVEGGLPHTRANMILFSQQSLSDYRREVTFNRTQAKARLKNLFLHEFHHVLSRHNRDRHDEYFSILGYKPCAFNEPQSLNSIRLTNPDAPTYKHYAPVNIEGGDGVIPFISVSGAYSEIVQGTLIDYYRFGLVKVSVENNVCTMVGDNPNFLAPASVPDFFKLVGGNTGYVVHPEETLADNFTYLITGRTDLPNPEIPQAIANFWFGQ